MMKTIKTTISVVSMTLFMLLCIGCDSDNRYIGNPYSDLPVYAEDNDNSAMVGTLYKKEKAKVIHEEWNDWVKIEFHGSEAYIYGANAELIDENGDRIWISKGLLKGIGIGIGVIVAIGLALSLISLVFAGLAYLFGLLMSIIVYIIGFGAIGWLLGYFITHDMESTIKWIVGGAILGVIVGIVKIIMNPSKASATGIKAASDAYKESKRKAAIREAEDARRKDEEYPLVVGDVRAQRLYDGTILDEKGGRWVENDDGSAIKIE